MSQRAMRAMEAFYAPLDRPYEPPSIPKVRAKRARPEEGIQGACVDLLRIYERQGKLAYWIVPNGAMLQGDAKSRAIRARILIDRGMMRPGVVDIGVCLAPTGRTGVIELKAGSNKPTPAQIGFMAEVQRAGGYSAVCRSVDEVKAAVDGWIKAEALADLRRMAAVHIAADAQAKSEAV